MQPEITLVHPLFIHKDPVEQRIMTPYFPLGLMYLAAVLRNNHFRVAMYDCAFRSDYAEFDDHMRWERPPIVGITSLITIRRHALILAEIAKKYGATVILGGPDPSGIPERYLYHQAADGSHPVDIVAFDEAEETIVELANYLLKRKNSGADLAGIAGLRLRDGNGGVLATAHRPLIRDLDQIPFPARDLVDFKPYRQAWLKAHGFWSLSLINTRGCPYACSWCQKAVFGRTYRSRSPENSAAEMRLLKEAYQPDQIRVVDDITGIDRTWVARWRMAVEERDAAIPFECLTRVNLAREDMVQDLKAIGCRKIYFGAESGSQKVLNAMNKGARVAQLYDAAERCKRLGIAMYFFMMVGYPGEEWADLQLSVQMLRRTLPEEFSTTIAYPLPGTPFYEQMRDRLVFESDWNLDWDYTAENKLLFHREKYNTFFYRLVMRWFHKEWADSWLENGRKTPLWTKARIKAGLWFYRSAVRLLVHMPMAAQVRFQPAEGR